MTDININPGDMIASLYQSLLGRAPDPAGLLHHTNRLRGGVPLIEIVRDFVNCPEFPQNHAVSLGPLDALPANVVDLDLSAEEKQFLWDHVGKVWSRLGTDDPYWSVLTSEDFRVANMSSPDHVERFYASGLRDIERTEKYLMRNGRRLPERGVCVDYGCGVGRITLWLARRCERVVALDVSEKHLAIARDALAARGVTNVDFHLVRAREDLDVLRGADLFHSVLVLQHNPPPIMQDILSEAFAGLNPGGCAFFQVPTYAVGYRWNYVEYVRGTVPKESMEMHVLPQAAVFDLAAKAGCLPLEVQPDNRVGMTHWISDTFVFAKRGEGAA